MRAGAALLALPVSIALCALVPAATDAQSAHTDGLGNITMALAGDATINRRLSVYEEPEYLRMTDIIRKATVAYVNLETLLHDYEDDAFPAASPATYQRGAPEMAKELVWMGFDIVSTANNHSMDFGVGGLRSTLRATRAAGLTASGTGENLALARAPGYRETAGGRVALISASSTFNDEDRAGHQRADLRGRPGLNPIRFETTNVVTAAQMEALRQIRRDLRLGGGGGSDAGESLNFQGNRYVVGDRPHVITTAHKGDLAEIVAAVKDAKRQADWVIVSSHTHEGPSRTEPAQFLVEFARAVIDAGADLFVGHGPHVLRGIEIYKGKPIFYSLGVFISQSETAALQGYDNYESYASSTLNPFSATPSEFYDARNARSGGGRSIDEERWTSAMAVADFRGGNLSEIRLYPVDLGFHLPRSQQGRPVLATGAKAREILEGVRKLSEPLGTQVEVREGVAVIRFPAATRAEATPRPAPND
jgi:poly-gamma-glutamate capsule biosynthesis protein CapA/YwtB (metallophosphatase superfamily)